MVRAVDKADGKYSKLSNNCASFESNTEVTPFEISNIRTALLVVYT